MQTENHIEIRGSARRVFELASDVLRWPVILPHYRWVKLAGPDGSRRTVEMAAHRDGIPVRWTAVQEVFPGEDRITFRHIKGPTTGMDVEWKIEDTPGGIAHVCIWHGFTHPWPVVGPFIGEYVVGRFFVHNIAGKTLATIKKIVEGEGDFKTEPRRRYPSGPKP
jgi:ribosome-associated toxin RatA of RatAB toxin-antitoxin module